MDRGDLIKALEVNLFQCELVYYREPRKGCLWDALLGTWADDLLESAAWAGPDDLDRAFCLCRQTRARYPTPYDIIRILADLESERPRMPDPPLRVERVENAAGVAKFYLEKWRARKAAVYQAGNCAGDQPGSESQGGDQAKIASHEAKKGGK